MESENTDNNAKPVPLELYPHEKSNLHLIEDNLYLGNYISTKSVLKHDIKAVLSVIRTPLSDSSKVFGIKYFCVSAEDNSKEDLLSHFPETNRWITDCIESGRPVLVHCVAGVSRSATVVCAYLMHRHKLSADEAIERVRQKRPIIKPNKGFFRQLQLYHHLTYTLDPMNTRLQKYLLDYWNWKSEREMQLFRLNKWKVHYNPLS